MLSIRLSRVGKKKKPIYRIIVLDNKKDPWGDFIENLGTYNPMTSPKQINLKIDRIKHWISVGAQPSKTMYNLLIDEKIIEGKKVKATSPKKKKVKNDNEEKQDKPTEDTKEADSSQKPVENKEEPKAKEKKKR